MGDLVGSRASKRCRARRFASPSPRVVGVARVVAVVLLLLGSQLACYTIPVSTDYDPATDFGSFHTFAWLEPPENPDANPFADNTLLRKRVREAVVAELSGRGFERQSTDVADLLVTFHVTLEEKLRVYDSWGGGYGYYRGAYWGSRGTYGASYQQGTLILDLIDREAEQLIWRGWGPNAVPTADSGRERIESGVQQILDRFPPGSAEDGGSESGRAEKG